MNEASPLAALLRRLYTIILSEISFRYPIEGLGEPLDPKDDPAYESDRSDIGDFGNWKVCRFCDGRIPLEEEYFKYMATRGLSTMTPAG